MALPSGTTVLDYTTTYTYDALNRRTGVVFNNVIAAAIATGSTVTFTHGYDPTNRRISQQTTDNSYWLYPGTTASAISYTANTLNQYTAVGSVTPTYDGNGNLSFDGSFTLGSSPRAGSTPMTPRTGC